MSDQHTADSNQWAELGDDTPRPQAPEENPQEWREIGDDEATQPATETIPEESQNGEALPSTDETREEGENPQKWDELGEEEEGQQQDIVDEAPQETYPEESVPQSAEYPEEAAPVHAAEDITDVNAEENPEEMYPEEGAPIQAVETVDESAPETARDLPEESVPEESVPQEEDYPTEDAPQEEAPESTRDYQESAPQEEMPESARDAQADQWQELGDEQPQEATEPAESVPQSARDLPEESIPQEEAPESARDYPTEDALQEEVPESARDLPEESMPEESVPQEEDIPESARDYPTEDAPQEEAPESARDYQESAPQEEMPESARDAQADQWQELGDEQPQEATEPVESVPQSARSVPEESMPQEEVPESARDYQESTPQEEAVPEEAAPEESMPQESVPQSSHGHQPDQWQELGDEPSPKQHAARSAPQPTHAAVPMKKSRSVARWQPVEHEPRDESDDEFEMSTCMAPVYEGEGESGDEDASVFKNGAPTCSGTEILSCFDEPNLLYRIIDPEQKTWAFYNDSLHYEMHVQFTFGKHSKIQPLGKTTMEQTEDGGYLTEVVIYPTHTEMFIQGSVNGFTSKLRAIPLSDDYHNSCRQANEEQVLADINNIRNVCSSDNAEEVLEACIANGIMFVDPEFPPCQASLDGGADKPFRPLAWARPQMYLPAEMESQVRLFRSNVKPGVVDAGDLGDTWVMCSVASVSEDPVRLMGMFRHPEGKEAAQREHAVGAYRVTFSKNGWWRSVLVDSYLPISAGTPKYAKSAVDPAEIWPSILEKAYAKLHGSYARICSGDPLHALQDMTGFSTMRFDDSLSSAESGAQLFDDLARGLAAGYTVISSTPGRGAGDKDSELAQEYAGVGLATGHAYTILDAKYFQDIEARIVKVRNAWGRGMEWNGDWSDNDEKWDQYPEIAEECNFQRAADGTFWMPWEAVQKYFNGGGVCFSHQPAYDYRMNCVFTNGVPSTVLEIEVNTPTWFTFVISQDDKRCQQQPSEYQPVMISIAEPTDSGMYKVSMNSAVNGARPSPDKWTFLVARDISLIHKLEAGKYVVVPRIMPSEEQPAQVPFVLGMISNKEVGSGDVSVNFKRLDAGNRIFDNYPKFEPELLEPQQPVQYQKRAPGDGFPATQLGTQLM